MMTGKYLQELLAHAKPSVNNSYYRLSTTHWEYRFIHSVKQIFIKSYLVPGTVLILGIQKEIK